MRLANNHMLVQGLPDDAQPEQVEVMPQQAGFTFSLGGRRYRNDRLGLAAAAKVQD